ncbi:MAG: hypothetical protein AB7P08_16345 [Burkholderiales bacterium]
MKTVLAAACLVLATLPARAQDRDSGDYREGYRRGYDDGFASGYRKGLAESSRAAPPAAAPAALPRATGPITVSTAYYGTSSRSCDATRWVARRVNGRRSASFDVTNEMCGDPARGERKELEVTYVCGSIAKTASAYEHRTVYLDCTP